MKFYVKNEFIYKGNRIFKGNIVDISNFDIGKVKALNVLGEPVKENKIERAIIKPKEFREGKYIKGGRNVGPKSGRPAEPPKGQGTK
jgi:hypothetical protein